MKGVVMHGKMSLRFVRCLVGDAAVRSAFIAACQSTHMVQLESRRMLSSAASAA
jgi:hypothetical protein